MTGGSGSVADTHRCAESLFMKTLLNSE